MDPKKSAIPLTKKKKYQFALLKEKINKKTPNKEQNFALEKWEQLVRRKVQIGSLWTGSSLDAIAFRSPFGCFDIFANTSAA